ncbi:DUF3189 family protein [Pelotomaculum propionicicum]|uniref:DUF3189 family protein n=1 Tax=Pelotomaculum propionicicum TaxID=258475 RepID=UPI003B7FAE61
MGVLKILYFSDSKFPLAALAGAIHTGRIPAGELPSREQLWDLLSLNTRGGEGKIISLGEDDYRNKVYALSVKGERGMVYRLVESFLSIYKIPEAELRMVDSKFKENIFLKSGKMLCRFAVLAPLGFLLARTGIKYLYGGLARWALEVKAGGANLP